MLKPFVTQPGDIPYDAVVTAEQAQSALGHNLATQLDEEILELIDQDKRGEEESEELEMFLSIFLSQPLLFLC